MSKRFVCRAGLLVVTFFALAGAVHAQPARNSVERNRAAMCAKADADGDSYRPFVCDPRCDCIPPTLISTADGCSETSPGVVEVTAGAWSTGTCDGLCTGVGICWESSLDPCIVSGGGGECTLPEQCEPLDPINDPFGPGVCVIACADSSECSPAICNNATPCETDADCSTGDFCNIPAGEPGGACDSTIACSVDSDCDLAGVATLTGVVAEDSPDPVLCGLALSGVPASSTQINSNDALECIAQIEASPGGSCTGP